MAIFIGTRAIGARSQSLSQRPRNFLRLLRFLSLPSWGISYTFSPKSYQKRLKRMDEFHVTCRVSIQVDLPFFFFGIGWNFIETLQDNLHILGVKTIVSSEATWPCQSARLRWRNTWRCHLKTLLQRWPMDVANWWMRSGRWDGVVKTLWNRRDFLVIHRKKRGCTWFP